MNIFIQINLSACTEGVAKIPDNNLSLELCMLTQPTLYSVINTPHVGYMNLGKKIEEAKTSNYGSSEVAA